MSPNLPPSSPPFFNRREFLNRFGMGMGGVALAEMLAKDSSAAAPSESEKGVLGAPHFAPKAKRIIYLFMSGGPSQLDLFDYKPLLNERHGQQLPDSVRGGQRLTGMSGNQSSIPLVGSPFKFGNRTHASFSLITTILLTVSSIFLVTSPLLIKSVHPTL